MGPKGIHPSTGDLFRQPLLELINEKHPLVRLSELIDWSIFETRWSVFFSSKTGRPATPSRLVAGLLYTLPEAVEQVSILTDRLPEGIFVDKGYRGVAIAGVATWLSGQKRGVTPAIKKAIHRRSAIESAIGYMKSDGRLRRNWLKGSLGDALHAVLCGAGYNLRMILRALRLCFAFLLTALRANDPRGGTQSAKPFPLLAA